MEKDIDLVIPMVFPGDTEWQHDFSRYHSGEPCSNVRFRSWGTEELLIECIEHYMPWVHTIHILLARESQVQPWMARHAKVHTVLHREFIPKKYLPTFASPCIEMFLGRIPGLVEQFIYANDGIYPLSPLEPTDFFRDGHPCLHVKCISFPEVMNIFHKGCLNQQNMIGAPFGKHYVRTWVYTGHSYSPILRSVCEAVWQQHHEEIERTLCPLSRNAHSCNQYIYKLYEYFSGLVVDHVPPLQYADQDTPTDRLPAMINADNAGLVCLNDNEEIKDWERGAELVRGTIKKKLTAPPLPLPHPGEGEIC